MSDTGAEGIKLNARCSLKGHSGREGAWHESTKSRSVVQPLSIPSVIHQESRTSDVVGG